MYGSDSGEILTLCASFSFKYALLRASQIGISSGQTAVLVFALYLNSDAVIKLYQRPEVIWGAIPIVLFWINWMWMQANRGKMHDDPLVFAVKDPFSESTFFDF